MVSLQTPIHHFIRYITNIIIHRFHLTKFHTMSSCSVSFLHNTCKKGAYFTGANTKAVFEICNCWTLTDYKFNDFSRDTQVWDSIYKFYTF